MHMVSDKNQRTSYSLLALLYKWLNRRSQRKSYNWIGFNELLNYFGIVKPRILHAL